MATIEERLKREMEDFKLALADKYEIDGITQLYSPIQKKFIKDAISSIDYVLSVLEGKRKMPSKDDGEKSSKGKVYGYLCGSIINITMAESFLYGKWGNIDEYFKDDSYTGFEDFGADYVNKMSNHAHAENREDDMDSYTHSHIAEDDGYDHSVFESDQKTNGNESIYMSYSEALDCLNLSDQPSETNECNEEEKFDYDEQLEEGYCL